MNILICVDETEFSKGTVLFGNNLAQQLNGNVTLLLITPREESETAVQQWLQTLRSLLTTRSVRTIVRRGNPVDEIIGACQQGTYDFIIVSSPTVTGGLDALIPSVAQTIAARAPVSVIVVKERMRSLQRILVCGSGQKINQPVIYMSARLAGAYDAECVLLHVTDPVPQMYTGLHTMAETAEELLVSETPIARQLRWSLEVLREVNGQVLLKLRHGLVVDEIIAETAAGEYDLVVLGAPQQQTLWQSLFIGQVAPRIITQVECAVMVVRNQG